MKIQIKEIGAIKEATIDLSTKLNVFCGPNGTGKTYMAYIIYAITSLENKNIGIRFDKELINELLSEKKVILTIDIKKVWEYQQNEVLQIKNNLWNLFALSETKQEQYFGKSTIDFLETEEVFNNRILRLDYIWDIKIDGYNFYIIKKQNSFDLEISIPEVLKRDEDFFLYIDIVLMSRIYSLLAFYPITSSIFFPQVGQNFDFKSLPQHFLSEYLFFVSSGIVRYFSHNDLQLSSVLSKLTPTITKELLELLLTNPFLIFIFFFFF
jgi:hypothetical protein